MMATRPCSPRSTILNSASNDGVILSGDTRSEKMTKRRSMSNLFGSSSRENESNPTTFEEVAQMRPGMKRRGSLRAVLQNQIRVGGEESPKNTNAARPRLARRATLGNMSPAPSILGPRPRLTSSRGSARNLLSRAKSQSYRCQSKTNSQRSLKASTQESFRLQKQSSMANLVVDCNTTVSVSNSWASVRQIDDYERRFGEQIILTLLEMQPQTARTNMRLESFFSNRFLHLCKVLVEVVDMIVTLLGPDLEDAGVELAKLGQTCRDEGILTHHLAEAVSSAVECLMGDDAGRNTVTAWKTTFEALRRRLSVRMET